MRTASDEVLHLLRSHLCPLPCVSPFRLRRARIGGGGGFGLLSGSIGVFAAKDARKEGRHIWVSVGATGITWNSFLSQLECGWLTSVCSGRVGEEVLFF